MKTESRETREVFGSAKWIWPQVQGYDLVNSYAQARRTFELRTPPKSCRILITADSRYKLYVNGRYVCRGPARGYQHSWPYDEVDIAQYLARGSNAIAVLAHNYGIGNFQYISADAGGIIVSGRAGRTDVSTGPEWSVRRSPGHARTMTRATQEMGFEEVFDAQLDDGSWTQPSYDDSKWPKPFCTASGAMPWHWVEPRAVPMLSEEVIAPTALVAECEGASAEDWRTAANLTANFLVEKRAWTKSGTPFAAEGPAASFVCEPAGQGRFRAYLIDFGEEVVGSIGLEVDGAAGGEAVDLQVAETITGFEPDVVDPSEGCKIALCNRLILKEGATSHEQFDPWGFRYLVLTVREHEQPLSIRVYLRTTLYPLDVKGAFASSDETLNGIYDISVRAQRCCMLDAYVDCPWREQAQWWGDARVQAANTLHLAADAGLLARGIRQTGVAITPNGLTYGLNPTSSHHCILPDYTLTWIMTIWDYYWQTGDTSIITEYAARMLQAIDYFEGVKAKNGLLPYDDRYWLFLDWADVFKDGYPTLYNIMYCWALATASDLFALIGGGEAAPLAARAAAASTVVMKRLFDRKTRRFYGGLDWKGRPVPHDTAHPYALAVLSGMCPWHDEEFVESRLLPLVTAGCPGFQAAPTGMVGGAGEKLPLEPSPFFMYYVFEALKATGRKAQVVDCIRRWWGTFLQAGFTTTPEMWGHFKGRWSACHAWSAHPIVHFHNVLLGVTQAAVAWRRVTFEPVFEGLERANGKVATPHGVIAVEWRREASRVDVSLSLPDRVTADVRLGGMKESVKGGRHTWTVNQAAP